MDEQVGASHPLHSGHPLQREELCNLPKIPPYDIMK